MMPCFYGMRVQFQDGAVRWFRTGRVLVDCLSDWWDVSPGWTKCVAT